MVEGTADASRRAIENVGLDHRRAHVLVPEKFLAGPNVVADLEQVRSEGVPECVRGVAGVESERVGRLCELP